MVFPEPVISVAVLPRDKANSEKLNLALGKMVAEDPSFHVEVTKSRVRRSRAGELHLDIKVDILKRTHGVDADGCFRLRIADDHEAIADNYTHKQTGGSVSSRRSITASSLVRPAQASSLNPRLLHVPKEFIPSVEKGFVMMEGDLCVGSPRLQGDFNDAFHAVDSSQIAFETAAKAAYRQSMPKAGPLLLEPIMKVDVFTPEGHVGDVIGDLNRRRGMIQNQEMGATGVRIKAEAPLGEMFGYIGDLRSMTSGRGQFSMEFSHYNGVPNSILAKVKAEVEARNEAKK